MALRELVDKIEALQRIDQHLLSPDFAEKISGLLETCHQNMINTSAEYLHGDAVHSEEEPERVNNLLNLFPQALAVRNEAGDLPRLQLALKHGVKWSEELRGVINDQGQELGNAGEDGVYPFLQAVLGQCELSVVYDLLRRYPEVLALSLSNNTSRTEADAESEVIAMDTTDVE